MPDRTAGVAAHAAAPSSPDAINPTAERAASTRRLLYVVNVAWFFLSHRLALARAAAGAGYEIHLASDFEDPVEVEAVQAAGVHFHHFPVSRSGLNPLVELQSVISLRSIIRSVAPRIVHNVTAKPVLYGTFLARRLPGCGVLNAVSGFGYVYAQRRRGLLRRALDGAYAYSFGSPRTRVVVQNESDRAEVLRLCPAAQSRVRLITGSGVDLERFHFSPEPAGVPMVLLPARLLREKGVYEFIAAAQELKRAGVPARFALAGRLDPGNRGGLRAEQLRALCAGGAVEWLGERRDMPECLAEAAVVCLPSYREGMPKVLLEAAAVGRPVVTTDTPGCRDAIAPGVSGLLVPPRDPRALAAALRCLLENAAMRAAFGTAARARAERYFDVQGVVREHLELYRELSE